MVLDLREPQETLGTSVIKSFTNVKRGRAHVTRASSSMRICSALKMLTNNGKLEKEI